MTERFPIPQPKEAPYPRKPFEEMRADILTGRWKTMEEVYRGGSPGTKNILETAENGHVVLRDIVMGWDEKKGKMDEDKISYVSENIFDERRKTPKGHPIVIGYECRNDKGEQFWEQSDELDEAERWKRTTIKDGQGNLLKLEELGNSPGETKTIFYDKNGKEGLRVISRKNIGTTKVATTFVDRRGTMDSGGEEVRARYERELQETFERGIKGEIS